MITGMPFFDAVVDVLSEDGFNGVVNIDPDPLGKRLPMSVKYGDKVRMVYIHDYYKGPASTESEAIIDDPEDVVRYLRDQLEYK